MIGCAIARMYRPRMELLGLLFDPLRLQYYKYYFANRLEMQLNHKVFHR
jgi:hypothetical protein